jgi:hypothetical protein
LIARGDVIEFPSELWSDGIFTALYAALPVYYDPDFKSVVTEDGTKVAIVWLVPISRSEAQFIDARGWDAFEKELLRQDPDLLDLARSPIV